MRIFKYSELHSIVHEHRFNPLSSRLVRLDPGSLNLCDLARQLQQAHKLSLQSVLPKIDLVQQRMMKRDRERGIYNEREREHIVILHKRSEVWVSGVPCVDLVPNGEFIDDIAVYRAHDLSAEERFQGFWRA